VTDIRVEGGEKFARLAQHIRILESKEFKKDLYSGINRAIKPVRADVKAHIPDYMPSGYAPTLVKAFRLSSTKRAGRDPGIRLTGSAKGKKEKRRVGPLDRGTLRHPTFGRKETKSGKSLWRDQTVKHGFFTTQIEKNAPTVRKNLVKVLDDVAAEIARITKG